MLAGIAVFLLPRVTPGFVSLHAKSPNAHKNFYFAVCSGCQSGIRIGRPECLLTGKAAGKPNGKTPPCAADLIYYVPLRGGTGLPAGTGRSLPAVIGSNRRRSVVAVEGTAGIEPAHPSCACRGCSVAMPILAPLPYCRQGCYLVVGETGIEPAF